MQTILKEWVDVGHDNINVFIFDIDGQRRVTISDAAGFIRYESVALAIECEVQDAVREVLQQYLPKPD